jgi:endo-1,4-beta-xylanase
MHSQSKLVLGLAVGSFAAFGWGCSGTEGIVSGTGGSSTTVPGTGGTSVGTGGQPGEGGAPGTGGKTGSGGAPGTGGTSSGTGGAPGAGGKTGSGGATGSGGDTATAGTSGTGRPDAGGRPDGRVGTGGTQGSGGSQSGGGTTGTAGTTGTRPQLAKFVGNIDTSGSIRSDFNKYWDQFSPENAGKWGSVQGSSQSSFNWASLDKMYKYCQDNKIIFKQHCFVWGAQQPGWTNNLTTSDGPGAVQNWMTEYCKRFPDVAIIDVVNEPPPHTTPKYANAIGGGTNSTWDWIANAFKWARAACPNAILVLNDYNNSELSGDATHTSDIVNAIKKLNAPIDAVGCQTHGASNTGSGTLKTNIDKIASNTGLPIYITEYDINQADDNKQKTQYQDHFTMFMSNNNIKGVTVWGYIVGRTWQSNTGIMQDNGTMRPAMTWLMSFLGR